MAIISFEGGFRHKEPSHKVVEDGVYTCIDEWEIASHDPCHPGFTMSNLSFSYGRGILFDYGVYEDDGLILHNN